MEKQSELFKWISDVCKTASWVGGAVFSYFHVQHTGYIFITGSSIYFIGMQIIAYKLHIKALEELR